MRAAALLAPIGIIAAALAARSSHLAHVAHDDLGGRAEGNLRRSADNEVRALPGPLVGVERHFLGHPPVVVGPRPVGAQAATSRQPPAKSTPHTRHLERTLPSAPTVTPPRHHRRARDRRQTDIAGGEMTGARGGR